MATLQEINQNFNITELENQLRQALTFQDPIGYMESNINWEIDTDDLDDTPQLDSLAQLMTENRGYQNKGVYNPYRRFLSWFSRKRIAKKIKIGLCGIAGKIQELIDEEAELKKILEVSLVAIATAIGIGALNPVALTILVGLLATMILKGVASVCNF